MSVWLLDTTMPRRNRRVCPVIGLRSG